MKGISAKQQQILDFVGSYTDENGYPPTVREIAAAVGLRSPSTVHSHIKKLIEQGYLDKAGRKTRTVSVKGSNTPITRVPILGRVTAGMPILAVEDVEGYIPIDMSSSRGEHFALRIQGSSTTVIILSCASRITRRRARLSSRSSARRQPASV